MNYLIRDKISRKMLVFWSDAPQDFVIHLAKKNQNRPDMIAKSDHEEIVHVLDFVPYHLKRSGYKVLPIRSKIIHQKIEVESFMTHDLDLLKYTVARDLKGLYNIDGYGIKVGNGKVLYESFEWHPGMKTVKLVRTWHKKGALKTTIRFVKLKQAISLVKL